jgi:hypothetical protein
MKGNHLREAEAETSRNSFDRKSRESLSQQPIRLKASAEAPGYQGPIEGTITESP